MVQIAKVGHTYSAYNLTKLSYSLYTNSSEAYQKKAILYSAASSFLFLSTIEVFDGYSTKWGFSWGDMIANAAGIALYAGQEYYLRHQVLRLKYS